MNSLEYKAALRALRGATDEWVATRALALHFGYPVEPGAGAHHPAARPARRFVERKLREAKFEVDFPAILERFRREAKGGK